MANALNLREAYNFFMIDIQSGSYSASTVRQWKWSLSHMVLSLATQGVETIDQVNAAHCRKYIADVSKKSTSTHTVISAGRAARAFFRFCLAEELIKVNPMSNVRLPPPPRQEVKTIPASALAKFVAAAKGPRNKALVMTLLDTGIRNAECCALNVGDVNLETGAIVIRHGKGNKQRTVYVGNKTLRALTRYVMKLKCKDADMPLWQTPYGRMSHGSVLRMVTNVGASVGIKCDVHTLRRTFATTCLRNNMNIYVLQRLMGHSSVNTLRHYLNVTAEDAQAAHKNSSPMDNL